MSRIRLTGHIDVPEHDRAAVATALPEHIRLSRAEPGCLSFEVTQDEAVPGRWQVRELFSTRATFDAHHARVASSDWGRVAHSAERHYTVEELDA